MIPNLTQHQATPEQIEAGVVDLAGEALSSLKEALTFDAIPDADEISARAQHIARLAADAGAGSAMIGGAPYLMGALENALRERGIMPVYAFLDVRALNRHSRTVLFGRSTYSGTLDLFQRFNTNSPRGQERKKWKYMQ